MVGACAIDRIVKCVMPRRKDSVVPFALGAVRGGWVWSVQALGGVCVGGEGAHCSGNVWEKMLRSAHPGLNAYLG